jgi:tetratricopeptide (TPR) repeat protein
MLRTRSKVFTASVLLILLLVPIARDAMAADQEVCDTAADFALGQEDYSAAVRLHQKHVRSHPDDALAHYHLGFADGMMGRRADEISEYGIAAHLGLQKWDLFLNLGLAYLDQNDLVEATTALETAAALGPEHAETHFNLALVYERRYLLGEALREITTSRRLAPEDRDAANTNAIICAEMHKPSCAYDIWTRLIRIAPDYAPARTNLSILRDWDTALGKSSRDNVLAYTQPAATPGHTSGGLSLDIRATNGLR